MSTETELIKDRIDMVAVVGEYVPLKRAGRYFKGLCPFHQEKTPSFIVSPDKGIWHCFGACGEGGDVFRFIEKVEGLDFPAALKLLAERAGVTLQRGVRRETGDRRARLFALLELAAAFYHEVLIHQAAGRRARAYLAERGVNDVTRQSFQLGYAPRQWDVLQSYLRRKGYSPLEMVAAGVVGESQRGMLFDRFRGRIIFPITDAQGRVVGFGGRITPWHESGEEGKYVNSPETELYQKRRIVYNLARAKRHLKPGQPCVVVEGYMDAVMVDQAGVGAVVASSGTAFSEEQIAQLKRFTDQLHFAFDADAAGLRAAIGATQAALSSGMRVATVVLPEGKDPADVALTSAEQLQQCLAAPRSLVSVLLEHLRSASTAVAREDCLKALVPLMAVTANTVQLGEMVREAAQVLSVPESRIVALVDQAPAAVAATPFERGEEAGSAEQVPQPAEQYLLGLLISQERLRREIADQTNENYFSAGAARELYAAVRAVDQETLALLSGSELLERLPDELMSYAEGVRVLAEEKLARSHAPAAEVHALLAALHARHVKRQLAALHERLSSGNDIERQALLDEFRTLTAQLANSHVQH